MPGVARANVAVTDTFDVWRVRTNEINTSLNLGTHAITANTLIWRDDNSSFTANVVTANTMTMTHGTTDATISVTSALAADGTKGSIQTTGGIKADLASRFGAAVTIVGAVDMQDDIILGNATTDDINPKGSFANSVIPKTDKIYTLGNTSIQFDETHSQRVKINANSTYNASSSGGIVGTTGAALDIASAHQSAPVVTVDNDALTTGNLLLLTSNSNSTSTRVLAKVTTSNTAAVATTAFCVETKAGRGLFIDSDLAAGLPALEIDSEHTTANTVIINSDPMTTGTVIDVSADGLTSGRLFSAISSATARTGHLVHIESTATATGATGDTLHVQNDTTANTVLIANFANSTTNVVSIAVGGTVTIDGDLDVTGATSQFRSSSSIVNDKTLVLGSAGDVIANCAYSIASPTVVTATAHGLSTDNVIFLVSTTGTGLPALTYSETVVKVTRIDANSFSLKTIGGTGINVTGSGTAGTISWTGNQTDSIVDDAGIYIPGAEDVHKLKWDNDDKFWEFNDSLKIDTATQLVLPKGTTAEQPAAAIAVVNNKSVAAAELGAMRYNTTASYFEGVNAGTTFEAFATQNFSTAIAVALG